MVKDLPGIFAVCVIETAVQNQEWQIGKLKQYTVERCSAPEQEQTLAEMFTECSVKLRAYSQYSLLANHSLFRRPAACRANVRVS